MIRFILVSVAGGIVFALADGLINVNPLAQSLYAAYRPIARPSVNAAAGVAIDLVYGFVMASIFLLLHRSLPGQTGLAKGVSFALLVWFFRVVMSVASTWMMFPVPFAALIYTLVTGLGEMLLLGILYGVTLRPSAS